MILMKGRIFRTPQAQRPPGPGRSVTGLAIDHIRSGAGHGSPPDPSEHELVHLVGSHAYEGTAEHHPHPLVGT